MSITEVGGPGGATDNDVKVLRTWQGRGQLQWLIDLNWKAQVRRFWWLRGVVGAMSITALVPKFFNLDRFEFLRAVHAVFYGWNQLTTAVGELIGELPFIPDIGAAGVNTLIVLLSICIPGAVAVHQKEDRKGQPWISKKRFSKFIFLFVLPLGYYLTFLTIEKSETLILGKILLLIYLLLSIGVLLLLSFFSTSFGRGLVILISMLATLEILYFLNTPWVTDQINRFSCEALEYQFEDCKNPTG